MIETVVDSIRVNLMTNNRVVFLKEKSGDRMLPIWIGEFEAQAIAMELQGSVSPRPMPHDLLKTAISDLGGRVDRIVVTDLSQEVFYGRIVIVVDGRTVELDCRPSDAIALAVRVQCPIMVEDLVMDRASVSIEADEAETDDDARVEAGSRESEPGMDDERLSVFRDFINTLDLDDFEKRRGS
jgi:bifunctional DNase/RNase